MYPDLLEDMIKGVKQQGSHLTRKFFDDTKNDSLLKLIIPKLNTLRLSLFSYIDTRGFTLPGKQIDDFLFGSLYNIQGSESYLTLFAPTFCTSGKKFLCFRFLTGPLKVTYEVILSANFQHEVILK